ncbi:hypothetical protein ACHAXN_000293, partial [Cyclotella atomus]
MTLYVQSILWDLGVPRYAATLMYEDNDGAIQLWQMLGNQPHGHATSTLSITPYRNGLNVTSLF